MKTLALFPLLLFTLSCTKAQKLSPEETSKIVLESFFHDDQETLKKYTTQSGYEELSFIQSMFTEDKNSDIGFKALKKKVKKDTAWIQYKTVHDDTPGRFKLLKEDDMWKITQEGPHEKGPFEE